MTNFKGGSVNMPKKTTVGQRSKMLRGKTIIPKDRQNKAKYPGKRKSKNGKTYYETRRNRADADRRKRL